MKRKILKILSFHFIAAMGGVFLIYILTLGLPDVSYRLAGGYADSNVIANIREELHLNSPPATRFFLFWKDFLSGNLKSFYSREPLIKVIPEKISISMKIFFLAICGTIGLTILFIFLFLISNKSKKIFEWMVGTVAVVPVFISATLLLYLSTIWMIPYELGAAFSLAIFPSILWSTNIFHRLKKVRRSPHTLLALNYRISRMHLIQRYIREFVPSTSMLFNAMTFFLTLGLAVVEGIFGLPGVGRWFLESMMRIDLPVIYFTSVFLSISIAFIYTVNSILLLWADPRGSHEI